MAREVRGDETQEGQEPTGNRAMRRLQKRQEAQQGGRGRERRRPTPPASRERTSPREFGREVRAELKKVAWPNREEVLNSTVVVLIAVVFLTGMIFGFDFAFGKFVLFLFD